MGQITIKATKTYTERLDVEITKRELIETLRKVLGFTNDYVSGFTYFEYTGDNFHNGDPEYNTRPATEKERNIWEALSIISRELNGICS